MKKSPSFSAAWISLLPVFFLLASASVGLAKTQKKSTASNQETPSALLVAAMKNMETGVWSVNGTVSLEKTIKLHGLLSGEDYDLTMEPRGMRGIMIKDKAWVCSDRETWHAGSPDDRLPYDWTHTPIMAGGITKLPFEKVGTEQRDGQTWLHIRLKVAEKKNQSQGITAILDCAQFPRPSAIYRACRDAGYFASR